MKERLISERDAARYLGVSRSFLAKSRMDGIIPNRTPGPPYIKMGKAVRYCLDDLDQWIEDHRHHMRGYCDVG